MKGKTPQKTVLGRNRDNGNVFIKTSYKDKSITKSGLEGRTFPSSNPNNQSINNHTNENLSGGVLSARQAAVYNNITQFQNM